MIRSEALMRGPTTLYKVERPPPPLPLRWFPLPFTRRSIGVRNTTTCLFQTWPSVSTKQVSSLMPQLFPRCHQDISKLLVDGRVISPAEAFRKSMRSVKVLWYDK